MFLPYNGNVPNAPDDPADDQPQMLSNTQSIQSIIPVDHFGFENNMGGYHQQVHLVDQSAPGIGTASSVFYSNTFSSQSWPIWQNAVASGIPFFTSTPSGMVNGFAGVQGGIVMQWGNVTFTGSHSGATGTTTFNKPFLATCFFVVATLMVKDNTISTNSNTLSIISSDTTINKTQFSWLYNSSSSSGTANFPGFFWFAMGV